MQNFNFGKPLCHNKIEIPNSKGIIHTYCYRPAGHPGKCSPEKQPEDKNAGQSNK